MYDGCEQLVLAGMGDLTVPIYEARLGLTHVRILIYNSNLLHLFKPFKLQASLGVPNCEPHRRLLPITGHSI